MKKNRRTAAAAAPARRIELTVRALVDARPALKRLAEARLPIGVSLDVARLLKAVDAEWQLVAERVDALRKELGTPLPLTPLDHMQGRAEPFYDVPPENAAAFAAACRELDAVVVVVDRPRAAVRGVPLEIAAGDLLALEPLVDFG